MRPVRDLGMETSFSVMPRRAESASPDSISLPSNSWRDPVMDSGQPALRASGMTQCSARLGEQRQLTRGRDVSIAIGEAGRIVAGEAVIRILGPQRIALLAPHGAVDPGN